MTSQELADLITLLRDQPSTWTTVHDDYSSGYATGWNDALEAVSTYLDAATQAT